MPSTEEREAQPVLEAPCPKCGSPVVMRYWEGRHYAKCQNKACFFGYDTDDRGHPSAHCPACGTGRLRTTSRGRVCADCQAWESPKEKSSAAPTDAKGLGPCPKCKQGHLAVRNGAYGTFVSCSERCGLTYGSDAEGLPEGGTCRVCQGPVKKTQGGTRVCALCGAWQEDRKPSAPSAGGAPPKPKDATCPRCRRPMKTLFTRRKKWAYRCDPCEAWYDA